MWAKAGHLNLVLFVSQVYTIGNPFGLDHTLTQVRWIGLMQVSSVQMPVGVGR